MTKKVIHFTPDFYLYPVIYKNLGKTQKNKVFFIDLYHFKSNLIRIYKSD